MKFVVLGAGGIGSYYGARLLDAGYQVIFIARGEHLKAMQKNGLSVNHPDFRFNNSIKAIDFDDIENNNYGSFDVIVVTTKSNATEQIAKDLSDIRKDKDNCPFIVSLQNGVENEEIFSKK